MPVPPTMNHTIPSIEARPATFNPCECILEGSRGKLPGVKLHTVPQGLTGVVGTPEALDDLRGWFRR